MNKRDDDAAKLVRRAAQMLALDEFEDAIHRAGNLLPKERQANAISGLMIFLKKAFPEMASSGDLDGAYAIAGEFLDREQTDLFGGNDAVADDEFLKTMLAATAHALCNRVPTLSITAVRKSVASWSGRAVSAETLRQWGVDGSTTLKVEGRAANLDIAIEKVASGLARTPDELVEVVVKENVKRTTRRVKGRPRLDKRKK